MTTCKNCSLRQQYLGWDDDFCTLECKAAWLEARVKELEATLEEETQAKLRVMAQLADVLTEKKNDE